MVPVHVVNNLDDARLCLKAERDENVCRKSFLPTEAVALGRELEKLERPKAQERMEAGHNQHTEPCGNLPQGSTGKTRDKVGESVGLSGSTYEHAKRVVEAAEAEPEKFGSIRETMNRTRNVNSAYKDLQKARAAEKIRAEPPPWPEGPFRAIVVDPPWPYFNRANDASHRAANPYPSLSVEAIAALPVPGLAHEDCVLWLWATNAHLHHAFHIVEAWGFQHKTTLTWVKDRMGLGDWLRGQTEHCLFAVRGKPVVQLTNQTTALCASARQHSRKPDEFYTLVEALCPGSKVELFARQQREGWHAHGNEVGIFDEPLDSPE
jgi:N6-adenosine-specific RNA methylase IME4